MAGSYPIRKMNFSKSDSALLNTEDTNFSIRRKDKMKNVTRITTVITVLLVLCFALCACGESGGGAQAAAGGNYKDGVYEGRSSDFEADESGNGAGYGEVTIEIKDGKIVSCDFTLYELDGKVKDDTYGADLSPENRRKAQKAVQSAEKYASMLISDGSLDSVDAISGATISHKEFLEAVNDALSKAAE